MVDVEEKLISFLSGVADDVSVYGSVPSSRPAVFVTVERTGGGADRFIDRAQLAVQVWAERRSNASVLASQLRHECFGLARAPWCAGVSIGSLYNFPDPDSRQARYQFTVEIDAMLN